MGALEPGPAALDLNAPKIMPVKLFPSFESESSKEKSTSYDVLASETPKSFVLETPDPSVETIP